MSDSQRAVRLGDAIQCVYTCKKCSPCPNGVVVTGSQDTFIDGLPAARMGDTTTNCCGCCCPCPNSIIMGSPRTMINGRPAARKGDAVSGGFFLTASITTFIG
jgi:uncharacterized Zn-binding protein involved in type VI secretion